MYGFIVGIKGVLKKRVCSRVSEETLGIVDSSIGQFYTQTNSKGSSASVQPWRVALICMSAHFVHLPELDDKLRDHVHFSPANGTRVLRSLGSTNYLLLLRGKRYN